VGKDGIPENVVVGGGPNTFVLACCSLLNPDGTK